LECEEEATRLADRSVSLNLKVFAEKERSVMVIIDQSGVWSQNRVFLYRFFLSVLILKLVEADKNIKWSDENKQKTTS
jgi:hypothetical protein